MPNNTIATAAEKGDLETVRRCLESGDDINAGGEEGTALWWAAARGHMQVATLLIEWGADLSAVRSNYTPTAIAKHCGMPEMAAMLEKAVQQPVGSPQPEKWVRLGEDTVAFVGNYREIGKKLTHIFNFQTRERMIITENLSSKESMVTPPTSFNDLPQAALERALDEFESRGGKADREYALHGQNALGKARKTPGLEVGNG